MKKFSSKIWYNLLIDKHTYYLAGGIGISNVTESAFEAPGISNKNGKSRNSFYGNLEIGYNMDMFYLAYRINYGARSPTEGLRNNPESLNVITQNIVMGIRSRFYKK